MNKEKKNLQKDICIEISYGCDTPFADNAIEKLENFLIFVCFTFRLNKIIVVAVLIIIYITQNTIHI